MSGSAAESAQYFVTVIMEPLYNFINASRLISCPMVYHRGDVQLTRPADPIEGVEVGYKAFTNKSFPELAALVSLCTQRCPFTVVALCSDDPVALPVAYDIFINLKTFASRSHDSSGESLMTALLMRAYQEHQLLVRNTEEGGSSSGVKRLCGEPCDAQMRQQEQEVCTTVAHYADFIPFKDFAFCFRAKTFVHASELRPKLYDQFDVLPNIRFVVGDRNTGKTQQVCSLIRTTLADEFADTCPSYMLPVNATLLVVPLALVNQWVQALHELRVIMLTTLRAYKQLTLERVVNADVIITTHALFAAHTQPAKDTVSRAECAALKRTVYDAEERVRTKITFQSVWWKRIVIDEVQHFYVEHSTKWFSTATTTLTRMWWGLQGGVDRSSHKLYFVGEMVQHGLNYVTVPPLDSSIVMELHSANHVLKPVHHTISTPLNATERVVYDLVQATSASSDWVKAVCNGDISWVTQYMQPVQFWLDAASQGVDALKACMMASSQLRVHNTYGSDSEEEESSSAFGYEEMSESMEPVVVGAEAEAEAEADAAPSAPLALSVPDDTAPALSLRTLSNTLSNAIQRQNARILERQAFFMRTVMALVNGTEQVQQCTICLSADADCIFVCGHTMCHECVVQVFEREHSGEFTSCPTCRWEIEPTDVFWVTPAPQQSSKAVALTTLLRMLLAHHHVLVVGLDPMAVKSMHRFIVRAGVPHVKLFPSASAAHIPPQPHAYFVSLTDLPGLKLPFVSYVVLLSPLASDRVSCRDALLTVTQSLNTSAQPHVYHLIASDTIESACE